MLTDWAILQSRNYDSYWLVSACLIHCCLSLGCVCFSQCVCTCVCVSYVCVCVSACLCVSSLCQSVFVCLYAVVCSVVRHSQTRWAGTWSWGTLCHTSHNGTCRSAGPPPSCCSPGWGRPGTGSSPYAGTLWWRCCWNSPPTHTNTQTHTHMNIPTFRPCQGFVRRDIR